MKRYASRKQLENEDYELLHSDGDWYLWVKGNSEVWWNWKTFECIGLRRIKVLRKPKTIKTHPHCPQNTA